MCVFLRVCPRSYSCSWWTCGAGSRRNSRQICAQRRRNASRWGCGRTWLGAARCSGRGGRGRTELFTRMFLRACSLTCRSPRPRSRWAGVARARLQSCRENVGVSRDTSFMQIPNPNIPGYRHGKGQRMNKIGIEHRLRQRPSLFKPNSKPMCHGALAMPLVPETPRRERKQKTPSMISPIL